MIFGTLPLDEAEGAILAHATPVGRETFRKGRRLSAGDVAQLRAHGLQAVIAAKLDPTDVPEDIAAQRLATALAGPGVTVTAAFTGRANLYAEAPGLGLVDAERIQRINLVDESLTVATVFPYEHVGPRQLLATVKVIPFAVPGEALARTVAIAREAGPLIRVAPFRPRRLGLVSTHLPGLKAGLLDKNRQALEARAHRLGSRIVVEERVPHESAAIGRGIEACLSAGAEIVLVFGASAIVDRRDEVPAGIVASGGRLEHFGMPVDPGNLLLLAHVGTRPVIGLPGCARSPKINGFDWVLERLLADLPVTARDIMTMGVGGLLKEIPTRPQPRDGAMAAPHAPRVAGLLLAAGLSRRMGPANKLLAPLGGKPLVRHAGEALMASEAQPVIVVTGHEAEAVKAALAGLSVTFVHNERYGEGLSASLKTGLDALGARADVDAALVMLADMPRVGPEIINRLIAAFNPIEGRGICVPTYHGKRGNPVLWGRSYFAAMGELEGDVGARALLGTFAEAVCEVAVEEEAVLVDIDTPDALAAAAHAHEP